MDVNAVGLRDPLLIRASAGTGKTYQLTGRLLALLADGVPIESILATTFTRKAAGEILTRVLVSLAEAAIDPTEQRLDALRSQTGVADLTRQNAQTLVHRLIRDIHRLRILTLDSLFSQLARTFGYELGLPPGWRLTDQVEDAAVREQAIDEMLGGLERDKVTALLAMLGKGETRRSVRREMLSVVNDGYAEARACPLEAWQQLRVPKGPSPEQIAAAAGALRAAKVGHKSADAQLVKIAELVETAAWDIAAGHTLISMAHRAGPGQGFEYYRKPMPPDVLEALDIIAQACQTHFLGLLRAQTEATGEVIAAYEVHLMAMKRAMRAFAFDDIAHRLSELFGIVRPDRTGLRLDGAMEHVMLDEFQDTSPAQWTVLKPLSVAAAKPQRDGSFFCVGDTKQAIYGWRGGVAGIFDAVVDQIPGVNQREQNVSFRSSPVVIATVNAIFKNLTQHPEYADAPSPSEATHDRAAYEAWAIAHFAEHFPDHSASKAQLPGHVTLACTSAAPAAGDAGEADSGSEGDDEPAAASGSRPAGRSGRGGSGRGGSGRGGSGRGGSGRGGGEDSQTKQARHYGDVAQRIAELAAQFPGRSIGVLTRTNRTVAWLIHLLRRAGVDVSQEGGNPLTDSPAVDLVLSTLMMAEHPADRRWWFHVAHSPLASWLETGPEDKTHAASRRVRRLVENHGVAGAVIEIADRLAPVCDEQDRARLRQLVTLAHNQELNRQPRLRDFVARVRVERIEKPRPAQVRVMTVHQSKGLEFDCVVLPELDGTLTRQSRQTIAMKRDACAQPDGMLRYTGADNWHFLPPAWQQAFGQHAAGLTTEALCLLYVAVTRARQALHMLVPPAEKSDYKTKTGAALIYHALGCAAQPEIDPTIGGRVWYHAGDERWYESRG